MSQTNTSAAPGAKTQEFDNVSQLHVAFAINDGYVEYFCVALTSLLENNKKIPMTIHVMTSGLSEDSQQILEHFEYRYPNCRIHLIDMHKDELSHLSAYGDYISSETWYRLRLPQLLPEVRRILYLDADLIVCRSLQELIDTDLKNWLLAGVPDTFLTRKGYKRKVGLNETEVYVNAGVLFMNLEELRSQGMDQIILEYGLKNSESLRYNDQDAINIMCRGRIHPLKVKWNFTTYDVKKSPWLIPNACIAHFTGSKKPWLTDCKNYFGKKWGKFASTNQTHARKLKIAVLGDWRNFPIPTPSGALIHAELEFVDIHRSDSLKTSVIQEGEKKYLQFSKWNPIALHMWKRRKYDACINCSSADDAILHIVKKSPTPVLSIQALSDAEIKQGLKRAYMG